RVVTSPSGLLYISTRAGSLSALATNWRPSISMRSPPLTDMPVCATSPLTLTRPSAMRCSSARREPRPAWASTLCRRSSSREVISALFSSPRLSDSLRLPVGCCSLMSAPGAVAVVGEGVLLFSRGIVAGGVVGGVCVVFVLGDVVPCVAGCEVRRFVVGRVEMVGGAGNRPGSRIPTRIGCRRFAGMASSFLVRLCFGCVAAGLVLRGIGVVGCDVVIGLRIVGGDSANRALAVELELRLELAEILEFGQRRQLIQALEAEIIEEGPGGAEQFRAARHVAVAD